MMQQPILEISFEHWLYITFSHTVREDIYIHRKGKRRILHLARGRWTGGF